MATKAKNYRMSDEHLRILDEMKGAGYGDTRTAVIHALIEGRVGDTKVSSGDTGEEERLREQVKELGIQLKAEKLKKQPTAESGGDTALKLRIRELEEQVAGIGKNRGDREGELMVKVGGLQRKMAELEKQLGERDEELSALRMKGEAVPEVKAIGSAEILEEMERLREDSRKAKTWESALDKQVKDNEALVAEITLLKNGGVRPPMPPKYGPHDQSPEADEWRKTQGRPQLAPPVPPRDPNEPDEFDPAARDCDQEKAKTDGPVMDESGKIDRGEQKTGG